VNGFGCFKLDHCQPVVPSYGQEVENAVLATRKGNHLAIDWCGAQLSIQRFELSAKSNLVYVDLGGLSVSR
jgi:hypothetical protein